MALSYVAILIPLFTQLLLVGAQNDRISIFSEPDFVRQRDCLKLCWTCTTPCPVVWGVIGCGGAPFDSCMCREDLRSSASSFLTSCINYRCTSAPHDVTSAVSLYNSYCHLTSLDEPATSKTAANVGSAPTVVAATTTNSICKLSLGPWIPFLPGRLPNRMLTSLAGHYQQPSRRQLLRHFIRQ